MPTYDEMHRALRHGTPAERLAAAQWMATCAAGRASVDLMNAQVFERDRAVRRAIRAAIVQRGDAYADSRVRDYRSLPDPAQALARALETAQGGTPGERGRAAVYLATRAEPAAFEALVRLLHDADEDVREDAARALARRGNEAALPHLLDCFTDPARAPTPDSDGDVSGALLYAIERFEARAVPYLVAYLQNPKDAWRKSILWLFQELDEASSVPALMDAYQRSTDGLVHHSIESALARIGTPEARAFLEAVKLSDEALRQREIRNIRALMAQHEGKDQAGGDGNG